MNRRVLFLGSTVMIGCLYSALFYAVFASENSESQSVLLQSEHVERQTLYWIQAGIFKEKSSYEALRNELINAGFSVYCIEKDEMTYVIVEPVWTFHENYQNSLQLIERGTDVILKEAETTENQRTKIEKGQMESVLMELIHS